MKDKKNHREGMLQLKKKNTKNKEDFCGKWGSVSEFKILVGDLKRRRTTPELVTT